MHRHITPSSLRFALLGLAVTAGLFAAEAGVASLIFVDTFVDEFDSNTSSDQGCSLREAVYAANNDTLYGSCAAGGGASDLIFLPAENGGLTGKYSLVLTSTPIPGNGGDLLIESPISILGTGGTPVIDATGLGERIFTVVPSADSFELTNVELTGGSTASDGGAINTSTAATLVLTDVSIRENQAAGSGGGIAVTNVTPYADPVLDLDGVVFESNSANRGGALWLSTSTPTQSTCVGCTFDDNQADVGGGVQILGSARITFTDSDFLGNDASNADGGGAIYSHGLAWVTLDDVLMEGNTDGSAFSDSDGYRGSGNPILFLDGGTIRNSIYIRGAGELQANGTRFELNVGPAIRGQDARIVLTDVVVSGTTQEINLWAVHAEDNEVVVNGSLLEANEGAIYCDDCDLAVTGSSFVDNVRQAAGGEGAAVRVTGALAEAVFENVTWSGNRALQGPTVGGFGSAAHLVDGAYFRFNNVTITGGVGTGLDASNAAAPPEISNSLIAGNVVHPDGATPRDCTGSLQTLGWNLIGADLGCIDSPTAGDQIGSAASPIDPLLASRTVVGGLPVHGLLAGSPALDAGHPSTPTGMGATCQPSDQVGQARPFDAGGGPICDIGAIEETDPMVNEEILFADDFESGDLNAWSSFVGG